MRHKKARARIAQNRVRLEAGSTSVDAPSIVEERPKSLSTIVDAALLCVRDTDPLTDAEHRLGEMCGVYEVLIVGRVLMDVPPELVRTHLPELRGTARPMTSVVPELEPRNGFSVAAIELHCVHHRSVAPFGSASMGAIAEPPPADAFAAAPARAEVGRDADRSGTQRTGKYSGRSNGGRSDRS